jgi:hypothetical protein
METLANCPPRADEPPSTRALPPPAALPNRVEDDERDDLYDDMPCTD